MTVSFSSCSPHTVLFRPATIRPEQVVVKFGCLVRAWILERDKRVVATGKRILKLTSRNLACAALSWSESHLRRGKLGLALLHVHSPIVIG